MIITTLAPLAKPVKAKVSIPGSKSYTNRALFISALSGSTVKILNPLSSDDTRAMINCLKTLGVKITKKANYSRHCERLAKQSSMIVDCHGSSSLTWRPRNDNCKEFNLNARLSGTTIRFMLALSAIIPGVKTLYGKASLNSRPIGELVEGLKQLGAKIEYLKRKGYPPLRVLSSKLHPGTIKIKGSLSSQYISALLMVAPLVGKVIIKVTGNQISKPYIDMTIDIMEKFGVKVKNDNYKKYLISASQKYRTKKYLVEGDLSSAGYFLAIAVLTKSTITLRNINPNSKQADMKFLKILQDMGNKISYGRNEVTITGVGVKSVNVDMADCPDQIQTLAVLAAFANPDLIGADGKTTISGISSLRIKETDRIFALKTELKKMGIIVTSDSNTLTIHGGKPKPARIETYGDHRMAMAFAVAGSKLSGMEIVNPQVVNKTFPGFWEKLDSIGIKNKIHSPDKKNIVLIGMRGSGKTTIARILVQKLNRQYIELDELIAKKIGLTIPGIVKKYGWDFFRDEESKAIKEVSSNNGRIISTGGGVVTRPQNVDALKRNGILIFLNASLETLLERMGNNSTRPSLTGKKTVREEVAEILKQRQKLYQQAADEIIDTDNLDPEGTANLILYKYEFHTCHCEKLVLQLKNERRGNLYLNKDSHGRSSVEELPRNDRSCETCLVIGDPVKYSLSAQMHNAGYKALGIDNRFSFIAKRVAKENLKSALEKAKTSGIKGISVTAPHKQTVMKYLDKIGKEAKTIGAVNTIINDNGKLTGSNTDYIGALAALEKKTNLKGKKVAVIGAGGAARAIVYGMAKKGAIIKIFNRSLGKVKKLAEEFGCKYDSLNSLEEISKMDIIINATSVGMNEDKSPVDKKFLNRNQIVFDAVYSPKETRLIKDAKSKGAKIIYGYEMLLYQGIAQFELHTGISAPVEVMRKTLEENLDED